MGVIIYFLGEWLIRGERERGSVGGGPRTRLCRVQFYMYNMIEYRIKY